MTFVEWRRWRPRAFHSHDRRRHHEALAHFTPDEVHTGRHLALVAVRQQALDRARRAQPKRDVRGRPFAKTVPVEVWINRPEQDLAKAMPQATAS